MKLPTELNQKIVDFLTSIPNIYDSNSQRELIHSASLDEQLQIHINYRGTPAEFFQLFVHTLVNYGSLEDGRDALEAVLEAAKQFVGKNRQEECDTLIQNWRIFREQHIKPSCHSKISSFPSLRACLILIIGIGVITGGSVFLKTYLSRLPSPLHIVGNVRFVDNGKPVGIVQGARIALSHLSGFSTKTDENGNFELKLPDDQRIQEVEIQVTYREQMFSHSVQRSEAEQVNIDIPLPQEQPKDRRIDAAVPNPVEFGQSIELLAQVRFPDSPYVRT